MDELYIYYFFDGNVLLVWFMVCDLIFVVVLG